MADSEHLVILKPGMDVWNPWRQKFPELTLDLHGSDMRSVNLADADFSRPGFDEDLAGFGKRIGSEEPPCQRYRGCLQLERLRQLPGTLPVVAEGFENP
jgi:hypothetical protein